MEEQIAQQTQEQPQQEQYSSPEVENKDINGSIPEDAPEPEVSLNDEGELNFRDGFFGDIKDDEPDESKTQQIPAVNQKQTLDYYTTEELQNTPFEKWDKNKLPEQVKTYYDVVAKQLELRQLSERVRNAPMDDIIGEAPKKYTAKEIADEARKEAMKKLGITETDEFSPDFDEEQRAAVDMARLEILQRMQREQALYDDRVAQCKELNAFNASLVQLPDFNQFNQWYLGKLKQIGKTHEEINNGLRVLAQKNGARAIINEVSSWYRDFKKEIGQYNQPLQTLSVKKSHSKSNIPPQLESTQGGNASSVRTYNMRDFGQLDDDAQAQALIDMGIV